MRNNARGHQQAREVGAQLAKQHERIDHVFVSPFTRTVQTANGILEEIERANPEIYRNTGVPKMNLEPGFSESLHVCQATPGHLSPEELKAQFPRIDLTYKPFHTKHYVETTSMCCQKRISQTLEHVLSNYSGNILIVSHGSPIGACHVALSGKYSYVGQCTISKYRVHEHNDNPTDNRENEEEVDKVARDWMVLSDKYLFKPHCIGDSSHLSDRTNLRDKESRSALLIMQKLLSLPLRSTFDKLHNINPEPITHGIAGH
uniref:Phosphoglycerate mutase family protein n=1 Tax=Bursaphelenchus xylophilus TaxID=6326 RepID=A0A1I7SD17_BURXY